AQRTLSRRQRRAKKEQRSLRESKNYQKQRLLVAKIHARVFDRRHDFLQRTSTALIKNQVSPKNTTQTCHDCGFVMGSDGTEKLTLADREWICPQCHVHHIRDYNAALNILEKGLQKQQKA
uniref:transposase n=1 Tax=Limosilactobacillus mucosae TaxID=97478 RepID=UPI0022E1957E